MWGLPSPGLQPKEGEFPKYLTVKSVGILAIQMRWKETEIPDALLKGLCTGSLTHGHTPWALAER